MFVLVATTVIVVLVVYVLSFLTQDILYLKRFLCVCVCVCVCTAPSLKPHTPSFPCKRLHHAMGTSERVQCVTRLNNCCEGDHGKRGTNAVYFCLKLCKQ